jgi:hypothetical protein
MEQFERNINELILSIFFRQNVNKLSLMASPYNLTKLGL